MRGNNLVKSNKYQQHTLQSAVIVVSLFSLAVWVFISIILNNVEDKGIVHATLDAESISAQILVSGLKYLPHNYKGQMRLPSSEGESVQDVEKRVILGYEGKLGKDPWGQSYNYKVIMKDENSSSGLIAVWSSGTNQSDDTKTKDLKYIANAYFLKQFFRGDDIGHIRRIQ